MRRNPLTGSRVRTVTSKLSATFKLTGSRRGSRVRRRTSTWHGGRKAPSPATWFRRSCQARHDISIGPTYVVCLRPDLFLAQYRQPKGWGECNTESNSRPWTNSLSLPCCRHSTPPPHSVKGLNPCACRCKSSGDEINSLCHGWEWPYESDSTIWPAAIRDVEIVG